jgi:MFS family permease
VIAFLFRIVVFLASAAVGLIVADLVLPGFQIQWDRWWGFLICIAIFAILQSALSPLIAKLADRYAPVLTGGIGIVSTLVALIIVVLLPIGGLRITDAVGWIVGAVIVWIVTGLCTLLLPKIFLKAEPGEKKTR